MAIPDGWATEHNLPPSQRFPWDTTKGVYTLSAFHTLHCLVCHHCLIYFYRRVYDRSLAYSEADAVPVRKIFIVYSMTRIMADLCLAILAMRCTASTICARTLCVTPMISSFQHHQITMGCKARKARLAYVATGTNC